MYPYVTSNCRLMPKKSEVNNGDVLFFETNLIGSLHM